MARPKRKGDLFVANTSFFMDGEARMIRRGVTRVRDGHRLLRDYPQYFDPVDADVEFDVEQATQSPGEKRNVTLNTGGS